MVVKYPQPGPELEPSYDIAAALQQDELLLYYQPKISVHNGATTGVEALLRWNHPTQGLVLPGVFLPLIWQAGLQRTVGRWVIEAACRQIAAWQASGWGAAPVAVNLSPEQLAQPDFISDLTSILEQYAVPPGWLEFEILEDALPPHEDFIIDLLKKLRNLGGNLYLDDFGIGYSSLSRLQNYPFTHLKIDRSFTRNLDVFDGRKIESQMIDRINLVRAIINLGHSFEMKVLAEGVETADQFHTLEVMGCDEIQGYFSARPQPAQALPDAIDRGRRTVVNSKYFTSRISQGDFNILLEPCCNGDRAAFDHYREGLLRLYGGKPFEDAPFILLQEVHAHPSMDVAGLLSDLAAFARRIPPAPIQAVYLDTLYGPNIMNNMLSWRIAFTGGLWRIFNELKDLLTQAGATFYRFRPSQFVNACYGTPPFTSSAYCREFDLPCTIMVGSSLRVERYNRFGDYHLVAQYPLTGGQASSDVVLASC